MGGSPQSLVINALPWIWSNRMTNLIQVTGSSTGDNSNEENIRSQSYFYPDEKWQEEADKAETGSVLRVCVCVCVCVCVKQVCMCLTVGVWSIQTVIHWYLLILCILICPHFFYFFFFIPHTQAHTFLFFHSALFCPSCLVFLHFLNRTEQGHNCISTMK